MGRNSLKYQFYATICANILSISYGTCVGWPSAAFLALQSKDSPLQSGPLTTSEISWVGSILCIGGICGNMFFAWLSDKLGRKVSMLLAVLPLLINWVLVTLATNVYYLIFARFLGGVSGGAAYVLIPLYVTEIAEDRVRGSLGACLVFSINIGMVLAFVSGNYVSYNVVPYMYTTLAIMHLIIFVFFPESPIYLMKLQKEKEAEASFRYFRNIRKVSQIPESFKAELEKLKSEFMEEKKKDDEAALSWGDFSTSVAKRTIFIGLTLMALNQLCGCFAMINYTANIFAESGSSLSPNMSAIIVGVIQLVGSYVSTLLIERAGRKPLLLMSCLGMTCGHVILGTYTFLKTLGYGVEIVNWIPILSFSLVIFAGSSGILTVPFTLLAEIMPPKIKSTTVSFCIATNWICAFLMVKYLPILTVALQLHGCIFIFAIFSAIGVIFVVAFIPETKGKSLEMILAGMEEKTRK
ncbi:unnamed protein product [Hermetia illucens]|uniref:Major facilitator superfamily (MFS) profile domain-containing protein n=2 Tax=Hermetia illucens TaxID=343691 RepID=A0A7R8YY68_HERIL|nr:unnamed protein product [Hermetia illucens]